MKSAEESFIDSKSFSIPHCFCLLTCARTNPSPFYFVSYLILDQSKSSKPKKIHQLCIHPPPLPTNTHIHTSNLFLTMAQKSDCLLLAILLKQLCNLDNLLILLPPITHVRSIIIDLLFYFIFVVVMCSQNQTHMYQFVRVPPPSPRSLSFHKAKQNKNRQICVEKRMRHYFVPRCCFSTLYELDT